MSSMKSANRRRVLVVDDESMVTDWLKITGVVGPDYRDFSDATPPGFDDHATRLYYDATIVITPTKSDTVTLLLRQFEQPAFGSTSAYEDITWEINARHQFDARFSASAGFRTYIGDWVPPVAREDWIYTASASLSYVHDKHFSGELSYSYDWTDSKIPGTQGREFTRHLGSLALKYSF